MKKLLDIPLQNQTAKRLYIIDFKQSFYVKRRPLPIYFV